MQVAKRLPVLQTTYKPTKVVPTLLESVADATEEDSQVRRIADLVGERNGDPILTKAERWAELRNKHFRREATDEEIAEGMKLEAEIVKPTDWPNETEEEKMFNLFALILGHDNRMPIIELLDGRRMIVMCACGKPGVCNPVSFKAL